MFLNDAVDQQFDRRYRPERPIVSGQIRSGTVWVLSFLWLMAGWAVFFALGKLPACLAAALLLLIILYDVVHKRTRLAPLLMAACRFFLYLVAAATIGTAAISASLWPAAALAAYIVGLSYLARGESTGASSKSWTSALLFASALLAIFQFDRHSMVSWTILILQIAWTLWCLPATKPKVPLPRGVAGLLAGIALVDALAAVRSGFPSTFLALFFLAILLQRIAPAT
jgi:4-hydroxybenzoate polyprenyltransferase